MSLATDHETMQIPTTGSGDHCAPDTILPGSNIKISTLRVWMDELHADNTYRKPGDVTPIRYTAERTAAEALAAMAAPERADEDLLTMQAAPAPEPVVDTNIHHMAPVPHAARHAAATQPVRERPLVRRRQGWTKEVLNRVVLRPFRAIGRLAAYYSSANRAERREEQNKWNHATIRQTGEAYVARMNDRIAKLGQHAAAATTPVRTPGQRFVSRSVYSTQAA